MQLFLQRKFAALVFAASAERLIGYDVVYDRAGGL